MSFMETVLQLGHELANRPVLADEISGSITRAQLLDRSGRVYAYLKAQGIGREDWVLICLPRGIQPIIAELGVWRAGAAFALVEDTYAPERIAYIAGDCECRLTISAEKWQEIMSYEPLQGAETTSAHDAAFAVYTSGTTGNPKGVVHEYGNLDRMIASLELKSGEPLIEPSGHFALVAPLNFVASMMIEVFALTHDGVAYVTPYATLKSPAALGLYLVKNNITGTFLTPSHLRKMNKKPPMLRMCVVGSEPANNIYVEGLKIHNFYAMSESAFAVAHFVIDKKYESTPVGVSEFDHPLYLLDEAGRPVAPGEEGEICYPNEYCRGYRNLPEETAKAFRDGLYHTGDLGRLDAEGRLVICGRLGDMVKVNGNRVEPGEIENVFRRVTGAQQVACRIFEDKKGVHICQYYTEDITLDADRVRTAMQRFLPYYMIPAFFIRLGSLPLRPNGKLDRKALPAPDFSTYQDSYVAPRDEVETALCNGFARVLEMERIGIHDDFYQLGGDSLGAMELIVESGLSGLSATDIFRGHTPERIAQLYKEDLGKNDGKTVAEITRESIATEHPLTVEQSYMIDYQLYTPLSTMYNLFNMLKLDKAVIDMDRMASAVNTAVANHPALTTVFRFNGDGDIVQKHTPEIWKPVTVEHVTEAELQALLPTLVKPFRIIGACLFRARVFETEEAGYLFMDVHHTLFDGTSSKVFLSSVLSAYMGEDLPEDGYYYTLWSREREARSPLYRESEAYFRDRYDGISWCKCPEADVDTRENTAEEMFLPLDITGEQLERMHTLYSLTPNDFFLTTALLTNAVYSGRRDVALSWIYNGRNDAAELASVGLLFRNLIVGVHLNKQLLLKDLYADVAEQVRSGITHSCYPYVEKNNNVVEDDFACVLYQSDLRSIGDVPGLLGEVEVPHNAAASQNILDMEILHTAEGMTLMMDYAASLYKPRSMERFRRLFAATAAVLLARTEDANVPLKAVVQDIMKLAGENSLLNLNRWLLWL